MRTLTAIILASAFGASTAAADPCPAAKTGKSGFVVARSGSSETEVFHVDDTVVRTVMRSGGRMLLETTQYHGLFQLDRIDTGRRTTFKPKGELAKLFPLKPGQQSTATFEIQEAGRPAVAETVELKVKETDSLFIGACRYDVLKIERTETRGEGRPRFSIEYYAPDLKLVIAKEYRERDGRTNLIKYDRIHSTAR